MVERLSGVECRRNFSGRNISLNVESNWQSNSNLSKVTREKYSLQWGSSTQKFSRLVNYYLLSTNITSSRQGEVNNFGEEHRNFHRWQTASAQKVAKEHVGVERRQRASGCFISTGFQKIRLSFLEKRRLLYQHEDNLVRFGC